MGEGVAALTAVTMLLHVAGVRLRCALRVASEMKL